MSDITTFSELIDKLITINIKLYNVMEETAILAESNQTDQVIRKLADLNIRNVALVKQRSRLKSAIDSKLQEALSSGQTDVLDEVKRYGWK